MLIILDIGIVDYGIRLDHKLISFDWRHINENFQKIEFWEKHLRGKSKPLHENCKGNIIMLIFVSNKVQQFFARNIKLSTSIADLRCDDVTFGLRRCCKILKLYRH